MARNFTISFLFEQKEYEADLIVFEDPDPRLLSVHIADAGLHQIIPESKEALQIEIDGEEKTTKGAPVERLKQSILQAFKEHENQSPPVSLW